MRHAYFSLIAILVLSVSGYLYSNPVSPQVVGDASELSTRVAELETQVAELERSVQDLHLATKLEGHWVEDSWIYNGEQVIQSEDAINRGFGGPVEWRLSADTNSQRWLLAAEPDVYPLGKLKLDTTKNPIWIDFERGEGESKRTIRGILKYSYKQVVLAIPGDITNGNALVDQPRPTSFESTPENGYSVFKLQRSSYDRTGVF